MKKKTIDFIFKNKVSLITTFILIMLIGVSIYLTFAFYVNSETQNLINGGIGYFENPDLSINYMVQDRDSDGNALETYTAYWVAPSYDYEYNQSNSYCTNDASFEKDDGDLFSITSNGNTKCYFYYDAVSDSSEDSDINIILMRKVEGSEYAEDADSDGYIATYNYSIEGLYNLGLGYNSSKSYCSNGADISYYLYYSEVYVDSDTATTCYVYFDEENYEEMVFPDTIDFDYIGAVQTTTITLSGYYELEAWGAEGGYYSSESYGGNGGYSYGTVYLNEGDILYVYVGGSGGILTAGYNGGGSSANDTYDSAGGGGGTDFRINTDSLYARVIVAGGGGGSSVSTSAGAGYAGGAAGGLTGSSGGVYSSYTAAGGGTQTSGGVRGYRASSYYGFVGSFGTGGSSTRTTGTSSGGGGGGGWYGGGSGYNGTTTAAYYSTGGGGGSGYVYTSSTAVNYPDGCLLDENYYMIEAETIAGTISFLSPEGESETGHTGSGYARLTFVSV